MVSVMRMLANLPWSRSGGAPAGTRRETVIPDGRSSDRTLAERRAVPQVRAGACPGPAEGNVAGRKRREDVRLVEPVSLLGLGLGDVLLGLVETGEGQPDPVPDGAAPAAAEDGPALRLRMPDGRVERELLLGGFWRRDKEGRLGAPRVATRREGKALEVARARMRPGGKGLTNPNRCAEAVYRHVVR